MSPTLEGIYRRGMTCTNINIKQRGMYMLLKVTCGAMNTQRRKRSKRNF